MKQDDFPPGWDNEMVQRVLAHYEGQTEEEATAEDEVGSPSAPSKMLRRLQARAEAILGA